MFNVGDQVRVVKNNGASDDRYIGMEGVITEIYEDGFLDVSVDFRLNGVFDFDADELEKVD